MVGTRCRASATVNPTGRRSTASLPDQVFSSIGIPKSWLPPRAEARAPLHSDQAYRNPGSIPAFAGMTNLGTPVKIFPAIPAQRVFGRDLRSSTSADFRALPWVTRSDH
jgi:hypothetical protein